MGLDQLDEPFAPFVHAANHREARDIIAGQFLAQLRFLQEVADPIGEVIGMLGRQKLMLGEEVMGVMVAHGTRDLAYVVGQLGEFRACRPGNCVSLRRGQNSNGSFAIDLVVGIGLAFWPNSSRPVWRRGHKVCAVD
jgi:hypothetical protein